MTPAAAHIHSDWSYDGKWPLPELARKFRDRGYRVMLMTEHDRGFSQERLKDFRRECLAASSSSILLVPGIEYSDTDNTVHILVWGSVPFLGEGIETSELLGRVRTADGVAVFAHPARRAAWKRFDPAWTALLSGIEIWNRKTDGWIPSRQGRALLRNTTAVPFVGLDFHDDNQWFPLVMQLDITGLPSEELVVNCIRQRKLRATAFGSSLDSPVNQVRIPWLRCAEVFRRALVSFRRRLKQHAKDTERHP